MKVILLAGGFGTRLSEHTKTIPKPMVNVAGKPMLLHIMKLYAKYGYKDFYIALGYKGEIIKKFFNKKFFDWNINLAETGRNTMTGGRLLRLKKYFGKNENFMMTYGDGLTNQNLQQLLKHHLKHKKIATMTVVRPPVRFGEVKLKKNKIVQFKEKPQSSEGWINGGFFVLNSKVFDFINGDNQMFEREPIEKLTSQNQLMGFKHYDFWQCMDTIRDKNLLNSLVKNKKAPWIE